MNDMSKKWASSVGSLYDSHFSKHRFKYIFQCLLATSVVLATLLSLNVVLNDVVIASIGSTAFIVFTRPHQENAKARYVIGGYLIGIGIGALCFYAAELYTISHTRFLFDYYQQIFAAFSVGLTIFFMVFMNLEHAPAAGLALAMVLSQWSLRTMVVTFIAIVFLLGFRRLFRAYLIDLH